MSPFVVGFIIGLFVGAPIGLFTFALLWAMREDNPR